MSEHLLVRVLHVYKDNSNLNKWASAARKKADGQVLALSGGKAGQRLYVKLEVPKGSAVFRRGSLVRMYGEFKSVGRSEVFAVRDMASELTPAALRAMLEHGAAADRESISRLLEKLETAKLSEALECIVASEEDSLRDLLLAWHNTEIAAVLELLHLIDPYYDVGKAYLVLDALEHRAARRGITVLELLENNPYVLAEVEEFRFSDAEELAKKLGKGMPCHRAVIAAVLNHVLAEAREGHSFCPRWSVQQRLEKGLRGRSLLKTYCGADLSDDARLDQLLNQILISHRSKIKNDVRERLYGQGAAAPCSQFFDDVKADYGAVYAAMGSTSKVPVYAGRSVYLSRVLVSEQRAASLMAALCDPGDLGRRAELDVDMVAKEANGLDDYQKKAVKAALENKVCIWAGYAGSGKTHTMRALAKAVVKAGLRVVVMAPTALAASRAAEGLAVPCGTVHRWAKISPAAQDYSDTELSIPGEPEEGGGFIPKGTITADLVFVDEMSMCDLLTFYHLLHAIYAGSNGRSVHIVLVGDPAQLPPIGPGGFFHQLCRLKISEVPVVELLGNHRSKDAICSFAHDVRSGRAVTEEGGKKKFAAGSFAVGPEEAVKSAALVLCPAKNEKERDRIVKELVLGWRKGGAKPEDVMVLTARRFGGTDRLNVVLREAVNPGAAAVPGTPFAVGDPVVSSRNDYAESKSRSRLRKMRHPERLTDVYNGTRGVILDCRENEDGIVEVLVEWDVPGGKLTVPYFAEEMPYLMEPAYALTVHKAQGGQAKFVAVVALEGTERCDMSRQMFYTAITRAKEKLVLVGSEDYWKEAVENVLPPPYTKFVYRLRSAIVPPPPSQMQPDVIIV